MGNSGTDYRVEYRVVWKREGLRPKRKRYVSRAKAERFMLLFGPEPWRVYSKKDPDAYECCPGTAHYECGCGGLTVREAAERARDGQPKIEYLRLDVREVGEWRATPPEAPQEGR